MHSHNRGTLPSHVPRPAPHRGLRRCRSSRAPHDDAGALLPHRARRAPLLGVLHRPHPEPQHPPRLPIGRAPLRRMVRTPRPRPTPGRADDRRGLHRTTLRCARAGERQAAPRRTPDALRLARRRPGAAVQSRELGPRPEARRQDRQDPGALREGDPGAPRRHRRRDAGRPPRPRAPRRTRLQLRAGERRGLAARRRLLHPGAPARSSASTRRAGATTSSPPTT